MTEFCDWTKLPPEACKHCTPEPPQPVEGSVTADGRAIAADYSRCPVCECTVWCTDPIRLVDDRWICAGCAS